MSKSSVAVVVLNWNDANLLQKSIGSLLKQTESCDIIVVDNASEDNSKEVITSFGNTITALWNTKNKGFAGGVNTGIRYALDQKYEYIALLNNDAEADKDWIKHLKEGFVTSNIGATTCSLIHKDLKHYDSTGEIFTTWGLAFPRGRGELIKQQFDTKVSVSAVSGGASMFRASFFQDVGLFDEDFFAYYEDVDLGLRGQLRGWEFRYAPKAKAYHATGTTSGRITGFNVYQQLKNQPLLFIKNVPTGLLPIMLPRFMLAYLSVIVGNISRGGFLAVTKGVFVSTLYMPKKFLERYSIQRSRAISVQEFTSRIVHDIPPSNKKLLELRSRYLNLLNKQPENDFSICIDGTPLFRPVDGIGRYSSNIFTALSIKHPDTRFTIVGFRGDKPNQELTANLPASVQFFYLPLPRRLYQGIFSKLIPINLQFLLPRFKHVIHLNFTCFPYIKNFLTGHTIFVHDTTFIDLPELLTQKNLRYLQKRVPWSLKRTTHVATISNFTKTRIQENFNLPEKDVRMIGTGIDQTYFDSAVKPQRLPEKYILAIGTLEPRKNLESLIRAYLQLPYDLQEQWRLVIGGAVGWKNEKLLELINSSDNIIHIGYVKDKDLPGLYQHASLFVFPSLYEGFGIPLLEAMASKVPILANDIDIFRSIAKNYISYVDATDINAFSQQLVRHLKRPVNETRITNAQNYAREFNWNKSADRLWDTVTQGVVLV